PPSPTPHASPPPHRRGRPSPAAGVTAVVLAARSAPPIRPPPNLAAYRPMWTAPVSGSLRTAEGGGWTRCSYGNDALSSARLGIRCCVGCALIIHLIIQPIALAPSAALRDGAPS